MKRTENLTTTERAKLIRQTLKSKLGLTSRDVNVRSANFSGGSSIDVRRKNTNKANALALALVEKIASDHERIDRCEMTGDILGGCNRYVSVNRTDEGCEAIAQPYLAAAREAVRVVEGSSIMPISRNCGLSLKHGGMWQTWGPDHAGMYVHTALCAATWAAEMELRVAAGLGQRD